MILTPWAIPKQVFYMILAFWAIPKQVFHMTITPWDIQNQVCYMIPAHLGCPKAGILRAGILHDSRNLIAWHAELT